MIIKATAIPLAYYPYSSTSRIVHWLTRHHGKVSTLLKGALRPKSPFLGEYALYSTSELLYFAKQPQTLHTGKECAMLHSRDLFRSDWRAMQTASYISALFNKTTPEESPEPGLFEFYEELLDYAEEFGKSPPFLFWAELQFCTYHGHTPNLEHCVVCRTKKPLVFSAASGGVVCAPCAKEKKIPTLEIQPDILAMLRTWKKAPHPQSVSNTHLSIKQKVMLDTILGTFMQSHFGLSPEFRNAATQNAPLQ